MDSPGSSNSRELQISLFQKENKYVLGKQIEFAKRVGFFCSRPDQYIQQEERNEHYVYWCIPYNLKLCKPVKAM